LVATGSPGELGLLQALAEVFRANHDAAVGWVKAGSGESLQMLKDGAVDIALVHAPEDEKQAMTEGWAESRVLIGANEFYIVGPESDPAQISHVGGVVDVYQRIAAKGALFISQGDDSGTHRLEKKIWKLAGVVPSGKWYRETHTFMLASLEQANDRGGYFMTDSST
jgi:tungstate transport system substrate-binding protein